jgi:N-6 DNA Methylase
VLREVNCTVPPTLAHELLSYGAQPDQLVDISDNSPRTLCYADLKNGDRTWSQPVVVEHERVPRLFIFDGRTISGEVSQSTRDQWCRRILLRGDPAWTAILRPGRLDVLSFQIRGSAVTFSTESVTPNSGGLTRFIHDVRSGAADLPRRAYLKDLLSASMQQAVGLGVSPIDAVSLVGWGLFWRFLVDRNLLVGKLPTDIADGADSWTACLSTKGRALKTFKWLDDTFNGGLLPFETPPKDYTAEVFSRVLGNIAAGATPQGQLRLPTDWDEINFSHVPVGLLSEVYEAFATALNADSAKKQSIHYTPRHIADFVVGEALSSIRNVDRPRVLDPAVGAGVFLIAAFRQLVQREWERAGVRPKRREIRRILSKQLSAFDVDNRALRLTQLGLYLTALELDPNPRPVEDLKFDNLESVLRLRSETDGSLAIVAKADAAQFDLVVGNPPWTGHNDAAKRRWVTNTGEAIRTRLGSDISSFELPDANPDLAFLWRAGEWAKPGGHIALVIHARWLFGLSERSFKSRRQIFTAFNVTGVLNGAALRLTKVWPNVDAPFCLVFARNEAAPENGALQFVSPFVEADDASEQTVLRVDWGDALAVLHEEIKSVPWALKSRFRGDSLARRAFDAVRAAGLPLSDYLETLKPGLQFWTGYQVGGVAGTQQSAKHMHGMPDLKGWDANDFVLDTSVLPKFQRQTLLFPRNPAIYRPPLLLVRETIPVDSLKPRSLRSEAAVAFHQSFHGVSFQGVDRGSDHTRLLQILLQSRLGVFVSLLTDARYGFERETLYKESFDAFPVIPLARLSKVQLAQLRKLSKAMESGFDQALFNELNVFVFDLYGLDDVDRAAIEDTLDTRGPTPASVRCAVTPPTAAERTRFSTAVKESLDDVLQASDLAATVDEVPTGCTPWRVLSIATRPVSVASVSLDALFKEADESGSSLIVLPVNRSHVFVGLPDRYRHWTRTQAVLLAHDLLGGPLGDG